MGFVLAMLLVNAMVTGPCAIQTKNNMNTQTKPDYRLESLLLLVGSKEIKSKIQLGNTWEGVAERTFNPPNKRFSNCNCDLDCRSHCGCEYDPCSCFQT